jgi:Protein of unknown function (DUF3800)
MREKNACPSLLADLADALHARWLVVIRAYADESEKKDLGVFTVAGYLFTPDSCDPFEQEWRKALDSCPRPLSEFKMSDCISGRKEFKNWTAEERTNIYRKLSQITGAYALLGISVSVDSESLSRICPSEKPYSLAVSYFVYRVLHHVKKSGPVSYFFDDGREGLDKLDVAFKRLKRNPNKYGKLSLYLDSYTRADSKKIPQLQAADMIAWRAAWESVMHLGRPTASITTFCRDLMINTQMPYSHSVLLTERALRMIYEERSHPPVTCCEGDGPI